MVMITTERVIVRGTIGSGGQLLEEPLKHNAFLGISLDKSISDKHLRLYVKWAMEYCRHCPVLIDDWEFRHNFMVLGDMNEEQATKRALRVGLELATKIVGIVASETYPYQNVSYKKANPDSHRDHGFGVHRSSESCKDGSMNDILHPLSQEFEENDEFKQGVLAQVERGVGKRLAAWRSRVPEETYQMGLANLSKFVLEETAMTIDLVERGYTVELYAGSPIQVVVDLYDPQTNKYPKLRDALNLRMPYGHVSLGIERIKANRSHNTHS